MTKVIRHKKDFSSLFAFLDIIVTICSFFLAYYFTNKLNNAYFTFFKDYLIMLALIVPTWAILLYISNLTQIPRTRSQVSIFFNFINFSAIGFALMFFYKHIFGLTNFSHYMIISFSLVNLISLYTLRIITFRFFKYYRATGHNISNIIIYADENSEHFINSIVEHREWGFRILMIITDSSVIRKKFGETIRIYPDKITIKSILDVDIIDEVIYCKGSIDEDRLRNMIEMCEEIGVTFRLQSDLSPMSVSNAHLTHFEHVPFITFRNTPRNSLALAWKSFSEFWISFGVIFLLSPIMLIIAYPHQGYFQGADHIQTGTCRIAGKKILYL